MRSPKHHEKRITIYDVPSIFSFAYGKCATVKKGVNGFASTGICPFNPEIFSDEDFAPSLLTDDDHTYHDQEPTGASTVDVEHSSRRRQRRSRHVQLENRRRKSFEDLCCRRSRHLGLGLSQSW